MPGLVANRTQPSCKIVKEVHHVQSLILRFRRLLTIYFVWLEYFSNSTDPQASWRRGRMASPKRAASTGTGTASRTHWPPRPPPATRRRPSTTDPPSCDHTPLSYLDSLRIVIRWSTNSFCGLLKPRPTWITEHRWSALNVLSEGSNFQSISPWSPSLDPVSSTVHSIKLIIMR